MIHISVVSGTYNRLPILKQMVASIRKSVGVGLFYEIVLVDGGSTDGTPDWCASQPDVVFIQQGKLLGACKAFNEGAYKARGEYVILANDDVEFVYDGIVRAYAFMQDHPETGIGCFYQNRYNKNWHVDRMGAQTANGEPSGIYYGQVCIVPKWLGDQVGWWGDYLHTYGGDNELSSNVCQLGYQITPMECACISDKVHVDKLRQINNPNPNATHADSLAFREKWGKGPVISAPQMRKIEKRERLLYAPIYEAGNALQKLTKWGLRASLQKYYDVVEVDYVEPRSVYGEGLSRVDDLYYAAQAFKPDIFLLQLHDAVYVPPYVLEKLKQEHPRAIFISWNGDYIRKNIDDPMYHKSMRMMNLATFCAADFFPDYRRLGIKCDYWQIGYEEYTELPAPEVKYDVIFQGNEYSERRTYLGHILRQLPCKVGIFGFWKSIKPDGTSYYDYAMQDLLYRSAKICVSDMQYPNSRGYVSNRLLQALRAGSFVLQQRIPGMEELLGYQNNVHLVEWESYEDLPNIIARWLADDTGRERIAKAGKEFTIKNHSFDVRVSELREFISRLRA